jgi:NAD(P)-dependent dehydrogenase (short-subunit alcohol dehydrogenase family)
MSIIRMRNGEADLTGLEDFCRELVGITDTVAEIGCYIGESSHIIARYAGKLYCIDPWEDGVIESSSARGSVFVYDDMSTVEARFDVAVGTQPNVIKIRAHSDDVAEMIANGVFDIVYIDSLHSYESVRNDICRWWPKVKLGGYLGGHNYSPQWPGLIRAVREAFGTPDKVYRDSSWVVRKAPSRKKGEDAKPVCLITGAGGRLGQELCSAFACQYDIIAAYRSRAPNVSCQLYSRIHSGTGPTGTEASHPSVYCVQADLTRRDDIRRLVEVSLARYNRIDQIVNSAADVKFHGKLIELWEMEDYARPQLCINCVAPMQLVSAIFQACWKDQPKDNAQWNRSVINVSSMSGMYAYDETSQAFYAASKAALNMLTLHLALELAPYSVRANALCPGRLSDGPSIQRVVEAVEELLEGTATGTVLSNLF